MKQLLLVGLGGFIGSIARYLVSKLNLTWYFHDIPMGTLTVNILGSILIGFFLGIFVNSDLLNTNLKLFLVVGICGGFTTFSSFTNENFQLLQNGQFLTAAVYALGSLLFGVIAVYLGYLISNLL
ncbi:MAG TPA: fluoride efflux transporter CrcB [Paludibacteraceae bacterium]|nr:fluoride efflux transporter CrcB [Paludibacteraceae bacterium]HPT43695.1 fluoride efflux transporter CrcB [Paludibacteraceae bacterium]